MADGDWPAGGTITITIDTPLPAHGIAVIDSLPFVRTVVLPYDLTTGQSVTLDFAYAPRTARAATTRPMSR